MSQSLGEEFENHVINSCFCFGLGPTYFSTAIAEETAELFDAVSSIMTEQLTHKGRDDDKDTNEKALYSVLSEAGDILWYLYALSLSLPGGKFHAEKSLNNSDRTSPILISCDLECRDQRSSSLGVADESYNNHQMLDLKDRLISAMGKLCGSVKKFSRGDQSWEDIFQKRIQRDFDTLLITLKQILHFLQLFFHPKMNLSLEDAMKCNINKISLRKLKGTIKGDGENR